MSARPSRPCWKPTNSRRELTNAQPICARGRSAWSAKTHAIITSPIGIQLAIDGRAESDRDSVSHDLDDRTDGRSRLAQAFEIIRPLIDDAGIGRIERVARDFLPVPAGTVDSQAAHLNEGGTHRHIAIDAVQDFPRNGAGRDARSGFARRLPPAAAIIPQ